MTPVLSPSLSNLTLDTFTVPNSPSSLNADALLTLVFGILATVVGITGVMFQAFRAIRKTPAPSTSLAIPLAGFAQIPRQEASTAEDPDLESARTSMIERDETLPAQQRSHSTTLLGSYTEVDAAAGAPAQTPSAAPVVDRHG